MSNNDGEYTQTERERMANVFHIVAFALAVISFITGIWDIWIFEPITVSGAIIFAMFADEVMKS